MQVPLKLLFIIKELIFGTACVATYGLTVGYQEYLEKKERAGIARIEGETARVEREIKKVQLQRQQVALEKDIRASENRGAAC